MEIGTFEAKNKLSSLLDRVLQGETIRITRHGRAIAELRPVAKEEAARPRFGSERDLVVSMSDDFDAPLEEFAEYAPK
ncbi:MAG: type II toxin-antitoxin system Phd/YefM family antitoxin [Opitutales bacterium]